MATFKLTIDTGNAAFREVTSGDEVARILRKVADQVDGTSVHDMRKAVSVFDYNGNRVGQYKVASE